VSVKIKETGILCPECEIPLVHIPRPIADDLVVCPSCGTGGDYDEVVEKGGELTERVMPRDELQELLRRYGYSHKE
jgi:hypothetical protein